MKVIIGGERYGRVRDAFLKQGHDAISVDLAESSAPGPHIVSEMIAVLIQGGDLAILHPTCTKLTVSGNRWWSGTRERNDALAWTIGLWEITKKFFKAAVMENPIGVLSKWQKPNQIIQPWQFGHPETKATCLWLHNCPPLRPTNIVEGREQRIWKMPPSEDRGMLRSITYQGIADAMAAQWGLPFNNLPKTRAVIAGFLDQKTRL